MAALLKRVLEEEGYAVDVASTGPDAIACALRSEYGAIVVEQLLPTMDAAEVCARLRARGSWTPVLMLCSAGSAADRVAGLEAGVDGYLVKPFAFDELYERLDGLRRRAGSSSGPQGYALLRAGDLRVDSRARRAWRGDVELDLSSREFALLRLFVSNPGVVMSRARILERVWTYDHRRQSNIVDQYVLYLRRKVDRPFRVRQLETVRGIGYRLHEQPIPVQRLEPVLSLG
jgi:two-component system OmpR family response regulator